MGNAPEGKRTQKEYKENTKNAQKPTNINQHRHLPQLPHRLYF
jgi:hypothetical protein